MAARPRPGGARACESVARQGRGRLREVTVQEYDAAVAASPDCCPLAYMGDLRRGEQVTYLCAAREMIKENVPSSVDPTQAGEGHNFVHERF